MITLWEVLAISVPIGLAFGAIGYFLDRVISRVSVEVLVTPSTVEETLGDAPDVGSSRAASGAFSSLPNPYGEGNNVGFSMKEPPARFGAPGDEKRTT